MPNPLVYSVEEWPYTLWRWLTANGTIDPAVSGPMASGGILRKQVTPTVSASPAYTSGDELGTLQTITGAARLAGGGGLLKGLTVLDKTQAQRPPLDVLFFNQSITVAGDNAPFLPSDADMANFVGMVQVAAGNYSTAWAGTPTNSVAQVPLFTSGLAINLELPYTCLATSLFAMAVVRGTPTLTSTTDLVFSYLIQPF